VTARLIIGDVRAVLDSLPEASIDLVLTSWPFLALRSYLPAHHPDKALEIGSEATPGEFIDTLLDVTERCRRVLAPHGSIAMELGDTYAGSGGAGGDYGTLDPGHVGLRDGQPKFGGSALAGRRTRNANRPSGEKGGLANYADQRGNPDGMRDTTFSGANTRTGGGDGWPLDKSLCMVPELFRISLVYGFNPLTGRQTERWRARNVVRWCRPNPPVGALADKVRPATSDLLIACTSRKRYFDLDAVRTTASSNSHGGGTWTKQGGADASRGIEPKTLANPAGAPPLDHWWHDEYDQDAWLLSTEPYKGAHYATWPTDLCVTPIESMCPRRVCRTCGEPSRRITESEHVSLRGATERAMTTGERRAEGVNQFRLADGTNGSGWAKAITTTGWTDCGHNDWRPGVVLDPFAGSGTTLLVASGHGRDAIGIDLDERNAHLAAQRVGMFLTVEHHQPAPTDCLRCYGEGGDECYRCDGTGLEPIGAAL
jgi:hypothetical protein